MRTHKRSMIRRHCLAVALTTGMISAAHAFPGTPALPSAEISAMARAALGNGRTCGPYTLDHYCPPPTPTPGFVLPGYPSVARLMLAL